MAIGECGLDFNRNFSPPDTQIEVFEKQVILSVTQINQTTELAHFSGHVGL